jgi:hypothetical protein
MMIGPQIRLRIVAAFCSIAFFALATAKQVRAAPTPTTLAAPRATPTKPTPSSAPETRCAPCHIVGGWGLVKFNHDKTGFPLLGAHQVVACKSCHPKDFRQRVPDTCRGCHRDVHAGELGFHCEGCHQEKNWESSFNADAHRRTNFPLVGAHANIPCQECHGNVRDRAFFRVAVDCLGCHQADYQRTVGGNVDHVALGFNTQCLQCHDLWRFSPARLSAHDRCFQITGGVHQGIRCLTCHTTVAGSMFTGACATGTAACTNCHTHACPKSDVQHPNVPGYGCADQKCYQCHPLRM